MLLYFLPKLNMQPTATRKTIPQMTLGDSPKDMFAQMGLGPADTDPDDTTLEYPCNSRRSR